MQTTWPWACMKRMWVFVFVLSVMHVSPCMSVWRARERGRRLGSCMSRREADDRPAGLAFRASIKTVCIESLNIQSVFLSSGWGWILWLCVTWCALNASRQYYREQKPRGCRAWWLVFAVLAVFKLDLMLFSSIGYYYNVWMHVCLTFAITSGGDNLQSHTELRRSSTFLA